MVIFRVLATTAIFPAIILASRCLDPDYARPNATDSVRMQPIGNSLEEWNISTAVTQTKDIDNKHHKLRQKFWMTSDTSTNISASDLPFTGCMFLLQPDLTSKHAALNKSAGDNGCAKVLSSDCQQSMMDVISTNLKAQVGSNGAWACTMLGRMLSQPSQQCNNTRRYNVVSLQPFGNPSFVPSSGDACNSSNPTSDLLHGSATANSYFEMVYTNISNHNHTFYRKAIQATTPVLVATWPRNNQTSLTPQVQMACLTPARNVTKDTKESGKSTTSGAAALSSAQQSTFAAWVLLLVAVFVLQ